MNGDENPGDDDKSFFLALENALKSLTVTEGRDKADEIRRLFEELSGNTASNRSNASRSEDFRRAE